MIGNAHNVLVLSLWIIYVLVLPFSKRRPDIWLYDVLVLIIAWILSGLWVPFMVLRYPPGQEFSALITSLRIVMRGCTFPLVVMLVIAGCFRESWIGKRRSVKSNPKATKS